MIVVVAVVAVVVATVAVVAVMAALGSRYVTLEKKLRSARPWWFQKRTKKTTSQQQSASSTLAFSSGFLLILLNLESQLSIPVAAKGDLSYPKIFIFLQFRTKWGK